MWEAFLGLVLICALGAGIDHYLRNGAQLKHVWRAFLDAVDAFTK